MGPSGVSLRCLPHSSAKHAITTCSKYICERPRWPARNARDQPRDLRPVRALHWRSRHMFVSVVCCVRQCVFFCHVLLETSLTAIARRAHRWRMVTFVTTHKHINIRMTCVHTTQLIHTITPLCLRAGRPSVAPPFGPRTLHLVYTSC